MEIVCPRCNTAIPVDDVNLDTLAARCRACNGVFSISDQIDGVREPRAPLDIPLPSRFTLAREGGTMRISWRWFTPAAVFLTVFVVLWNGFICFWLSAALAAGAWPMMLFASLHILVGIVLAYTALSMYLNHTEIEAGIASLSVRHGPLPAFGNFALPRDSLRQFYCMERVHRSRNSSSISYDVQAIKADGSAVALIRGLPTVEQALYLEQELERHLGIRDEPVRGEL